MGGACDARTLAGNVEGEGGFQFRNIVFDKNDGAHKEALREYAAGRVG